MPQWVDWTYRKEWKSGLVPTFNNVFLLLQVAKKWCRASKHVKPRRNRHPWVMQSCHHLGWLFHEGNTRYLQPLLDGYAQDHQNEHDSSWGNYCRREQDKSWRKAHVLHCEQVQSEKWPSGRVVSGQKNINSGKSSLIRFHRFQIFRTWKADHCTSSAISTQRLFFFGWSTFKVLISMRIERLLISPCSTGTGPNKRLLYTHVTNCWKHLKEISALLMKGAAPYAWRITN